MHLQVQYNSQINTVVRLKNTFENTFEINTFEKQERNNANQCIIFTLR